MVQLLLLVGFLAAYTGLILWRLFVRLDSVRHPLKTYGDIAERIFGRAARHVCTVLQSIQLLVNVRPSECLHSFQLKKYGSKNRLPPFVWVMVKRSLKSPREKYVLDMCVSTFFDCYCSSVSRCALSFGL